MFELESVGAYNSAKPIRIDEAAQQFLAYRSLNETVGHDTARFKRYILPELKGQYLDQINRNQWIKILGDSKQNRPGSLMSKHKLSTRTANHIRTLLHTFYEFVIDQKDTSGMSIYRCPTNPIKSIEPWPKYKKKIQHLATAKQVEMYLSEAKRIRHARHFYIFAMLALNTGQRSSTIRGLRWEDVDFHNRTITFRYKWSERQKCFVRGLKGDKTSSGDEATEHVTGMNLELKKVLEEWKRETHWKRPQDFVCARPEDGQYLTRQTLFKANRRALRMAGLPVQKVHALRHTYATHYLNMGGSIYKLKEILNHSTITTTEMYIRQSAREQNSMTDILTFKPKSEESATVTQIYS